MKNKSIITSFIVLIVSCYSCKKQEKEIGTTFASVSFMDSDGIHITSNLLYQGDPIGGTGIWSDGKITVLPGKGKFTFINKATDSVLLDTVLNIDTNNPKQYYITQIEVGLPFQLLQNTQESELPVREGTIKIRLANLAKTALPKSKIKVIFSQLDWNTFEYFPVDTLENVTRSTPETFTEIKRGTFIDQDGNPITDYDYMLTFLDENDQPIVDSSDTPISLTFSTANSVYTVYILEDATGGGEPYVYTKTLFEN